ncbi:MAG: purine-nucleoside phosphorylase [Selenomonadaceae bacterium]|nr:purine-nucleoside phosphorylase [Selenomonadaceae bacterium]MDY2685359.1 purine-nucleoside phosphorylase [Selenomonadaceae bacterium]
MATPHIGAEKGDIAERILLPGDPLRAKFIAENFLDGAKEYTHVRNILGYTGTYKGVPVSVQGTGMGIPSLMIYVHELIHEFGCKKLIRVGTCGAMHKKVHLRDVLIAQGATTDSSIMKSIFGLAINYAPLADFNLLEKAVNAARSLDLRVTVGNVFSADRFYDPDVDNDRLRKYGILGVEMETAGLYTLAAEADVQALGIFTVSDHLLTGEACTAEERQTTFQDMMKIALETAIAD